MFFPKLRRQAKWMFVFLALVFGVGFVGFGVGSGGSGLDQLWSNLGGGGSTGTSVDDAQKKIEKGDFAAYKELADAYRAEGKQDEAIAAGEKYLEFRPRALAFARTLAGDYQGKATAIRNQAAVVQQQLTMQTGGTTFGLPQSSKLGRAIGTGRIDSELQAAANKELTELYSELDSSYRRATELYQAVAVKNPSDPLLQQLLGQTAAQARLYDVAIRAYRRVIKLAPGSGEAEQARRDIRFIKAQQRAAGATLPGNIPSG
jgi:tetratricopeptide (TPR) repeat protein